MEPSTLPHISVCICTFKRPALLARLLASIEQQRTNGAFTLSVVVTDNDHAESARAAVEAYRRDGTLEVVYAVEPRANIALARNRALDQARGDYVAFIDDDEFAEPDWLLQLLRACDSLGASGILGPVRPHFDSSPPHWLIKGRFCERAEHPTGTLVPSEEGRTGNVLLRRSLVAGEHAPFREQFGTGGEDKDFFMRMSQRGAVFRWCNEAVVHECVPPERWTRRYVLRRALLRGRNNLKISHGRLGLLGRSLVATPLYALALPLAAPLGQHVLMKIGIRLCDHAGRLLTLVGLNPVQSR
jgi:succinoglycan biosynthesis protein ExoM